MTPTNTEIWAVSSVNAYQLGQIFGLGITQSNETVGMGLSGIISDGRMGSCLEIQIQKNQSDFQANAMLCGYDQPFRLPFQVIELDKENHLGQTLRSIPHPTDSHGKGKKLSSHS